MQPLYGTECFDAIVPYPPYFWFNEQTAWAADGIPLNPRLPETFFDLEQQRQPRELVEWSGRPFVTSVENGASYDVWCLIDGEVQRLGNHPDLLQAVAAIQERHQK